MRKRIKLQSCDGEEVEIDDEVLSMCSTIKNMLKGRSAFKNSLGGQFSIEGSYVILKKEGRILASLSKNDEEEALISLPDVKASTLHKVLEYCHCHYSSALSDKEKKNWDAAFVQVKQAVLCELASASYFLDIKPLVNLTSKAIAAQISGKSSDEIRETFSNINYEAYAPVFASSLAVRARLQRKFNKKQQEAEEKLRLENERQQNQQLITNNAHNSTNSTEDKKDSSESTNEQEKTPKSKRKKKRNRKVLSEVQQNPVSTNEILNDEKENEPILVSQKSEEERKQIEEELLNGGSEDEGEDDEFDPERLAALDKEVEEFRLRLEQINSQTRNAPKIQLEPSASYLVKSSMIVGR